MKDKKISHSFLPASMLDIALRRYDEVCITGGEPLLVLPKVMQLVALVRYFNPNVTIYLYTNGIELTRATATILKLSGIAALNVSLHYPSYYSTELHELAYLHRNFLPIRILVGEKEVTSRLRDFALISNIPMRIWKMDDCKDMPPEERWRIK